MIPLSSTDTPGLDFDIKAGENSKKTILATNKIGWVHTLSDKPGAKFDIIMKDALGRVMFEKKSCGNATEKYGELVNIGCQMGDNVEVIIENVKGADKIRLFMN